MTRSPTPPRQDDVATWFEQTYRSAGFRYLRPLAAYPIFLQLLDTRPGEHLLDIACGPGLLLKAAVERGVRASGIDLARAAVDLARRFVPEADVRQGNAETLPFADDTFDCVTCIGSLERFLDRSRALREMRRVARPGARLCLMVRNADTLSWRLWRRALGRQNLRGHQDAGTLDEWRGLFEDQGFTVEQVHVDQWLRQRLRRILRGFRDPGPDRPEPVARPVLPLRWANEFVFVLRPG